MANYEKPVIIDTEEHYEAVTIPPAGFPHRNATANTLMVYGMHRTIIIQLLISSVSAVTDVRLSVTTAADSSLKNTGEATMLITATAIRTGSVSDTSLMMRLTGAMSVCDNT